MPSLVSPALPPGTLGGDPQPTLLAPGLVLRPWLHDDVRVLVEAYADPAIQRWHGRSLTATEAEGLVASWHAAWRADQGASWAVVEDLGGPGGMLTPVLGRVGLRDVDLEEGNAEISYWVIPGARGRGVASAAVARLVGWSFDLGLHRLTVMHSVANPASCAVARRAGLPGEATLRGAVRHADGWHDMHLHALLATDVADVGDPS